MAVTTSFHKKAQVIYVCKQVAEGVPVVNGSPTGTITTTVGSANVTGTGTLFTTQVPVGAYLYTTANAIIGRVKTVTSNTAIVLEDVVPGSATAQSAGVMAVATAVTGVAFKIDFGPKNAIPVLDLDPSTEVDTESFQYTGDETSREETTSVKDIYMKLSFSHFLPKRGTIAGNDPVLSEIPLADLFQAVGFGIILSTGSGGYWTASNAVSTNTFLSISLRKSSSAMPTTQKEVLLTDVRGLIDIDFSVGTKPKLKYNLQGNRSTISDKFSIVHNFTTLTTNISPSLRQDTIGLSELVLYSSESEPNIVGTTNFCFNKLTANNATGYEFNRLLLACLGGWSRGALASDVVVSIKEEEASANYNPDSHYEENHKLVIRYGKESALSTVGDRVEITFTKLQLQKTSSALVADYTGQDLNFRNVGNIKIKFY